MKSFISICRMSQKDLHTHLRNILRDYGYTIFDHKKYIYAFCQKEPVLLTAHLDTVFKETVKSVTVEKHETGTIISSPQGIGGDDRCGVWMILQALFDGYRPAILFCHDEEIGGLGSKELCRNTPKKIKKDIEKLKYMIEIDRANKNDCVFYDCDNPEFTEYVESFGFKEAYGTFSDISNLAPQFKKAAVNISTGDYKQHQKEEYVVYEEMVENYERLKLMLDDSISCKEYEYIECLYNNYKWYNYGGCRNPFDAGYDYYGYGYYDDGFNVALEIEYIERRKRKTDVIYGRSEQEAIGEFLMAHPSICMDDVQILDIDYEYI